MKRCLITGVGGFLGSHLAEFLLAQDVAVYGTVHRDTKNIEHLKRSLTVLPCDILEREQVETTVREAQPQVAYHLAACSLPLLSWQEPALTLQVNVLGTLHLLEAVRRVSAETTIVVVGSSAEYGMVGEEEIPIKEDRPPFPASPYGVSKVAADLLARLYWQAYGMKVVRVRPFLVIGPRKVGDVCSDFARGVVAVQRGQSDRLRVGNLEAVRDFLDVRDAVQALSLLADKATPGEVYNVCSGVGHRVREVLELLIALSGNEVRYRVVPEKLRPYDVRICIGDNLRLKALGWKPQIPLERTLADILDYWRASSSA